MASTNDQACRPHAASASVLVRAALLVAGSLAAFWHVWADIGTVAARDEEASHAFLVPLIVAWLFWVRRERLTQVVGRNHHWGIALFALAVCSHEVGLNCGLQILWHLSAVLSLFAGLCFAFGTHFFRKFAAVAFACLFVVPVPGLIRQSISQPIQYRSAQITQQLLSSFGVDVQQFGNVLQVNGTLVTIAEACNGMRMLFATLLIIYALCYSLPINRNWKTILMLGSPLAAMGMNIVRLVLAVLCYGNLSPEMAEWCHDISGWVVPLSLMGLAVYFADAQSDDEAAMEQTDQPFRFQTHAHLAIMAGCLFAVAAFTHSMLIPSNAAVETHRLAIQQHFDGVPYAVSGWVASDADLHEAEVSLLRPTAGLRRNYRNLETDDEVSIVAVASGRARDMIGHEPSVCLVGQGWTMSERVPMKLDYGKTLVGVDDLKFQFSHEQSNVSRRVTSVLVVPGGNSSGSGRIVAETASDFRLEAFGAMSIQISTANRFTDEAWKTTSKQLLAMFLPAIEQYRACHPSPNQPTKLVADTNQD